MKYSLIIFFMCILIDQATKVIAMRNSYIINNGLALNIGQGLPTYYLIIIICCIITWISVVNFKFWKNNKNMPELVVIAGGVSNLIDRFIYTGVIDFLIIDFKISNLKISTPIFNFADIIIMIGILWIIYRDMANQSLSNLQH